MNDNKPEWWWRHVNENGRINIFSFEIISFEKKDETRERLKTCTQKEEAFFGKICILAKRTIINVITSRVLCSARALKLYTEAKRESQRRIPANRKRSLEHD